MRTVILFAFWLLQAGAAVQAQTAPDWHAQVAAKLAEAGPGTRFGLAVTTRDGLEIIAIAADDRFVPASNTKLFTTAAGFATLAGIDAADEAGATSILLSGRESRPDIRVLGRGDARLSSAPDCVTGCLRQLADAIAARTRRVNDIVGDARWFPDERWSLGMSWNNVAERSGTAIAALSLDSNEIALTVTPAAIPGDRPALALGSAYLTVDNRATTGPAGSANTLDVMRLPFERTVRLTGSIPAGGAADTVRLGVDDPAHFAAWTLAGLLHDRGVKVKGGLRALYRQEGDAPATVATEDREIARTVPAPLLADIGLINKVSQNMHAELLIRRIGRASGTGSVRDGLARVQAMLEGAGLPRTAYDFADGSGMSTYNRISPRGMVRFLRWTQAQPWGAAFRATLPIGGVDGTIGRRFRGTPLEGRIFAKTGTLNGTNALSGMMIAASGQELTFSIIANDVPSDRRAVPTMDAALLLIAAAN